MTERTNYPLCWPENWPRTNPAWIQQSRFKGNTVASSVRAITNEVNRLNNRHWDFDDPKLIISTNLKPRLDGLPSGGQAQPADRGVAVYFELARRDSARRSLAPLPVTLACDKWSRVEDNLWAIAKHIEALRGQERWGVGRIEQAFRGYTAIPERTGGISWWTVLQVDHNATEDQVKSRYLELAKQHHPDKGGDPEEWMKIRQAFDQAQALFRR